MAIKRYGVLKAVAVDFHREDNDPTPHFRLFGEANSQRFRVPINVRSRLSPSELVYFVDADFQHPITTQLVTLPNGYTRLPEEERKGLDYLRGNLFDLERVIALPHNLPGQDDDLQDILTSHVQTAINVGDGASVFAFGEPFPGSGDINASIEGMHDIHMNQGNHPSFQSDDGVFHDGGLMFHFPDRGRFVAIFLAFQSQALNTDNHTGHAIPGSQTFEDIIRGGIVEPSPDEPGTIPQRFHHVRIVGALINPEGGENQPSHVGPPESVTLLNSTPEAIMLDGWSLMDRNQNRQLLDGHTIEAGETLKVSLGDSPVVLGNTGGMLSLLDENEVKIDGISYTRDDAAKEGWTVVF